MIHDIPAERRLILFLTAATALLVVVGVAANAAPIDFSPSGGASDTANVRATGGGNSAPDLAVIGDGEPDAPIRQAELPGWLLWLVGAAGFGVAGWFLTRQRFRLLVGRRRTGRVESASVMSEQRQAEVIADFAEELIAELELDADPRTAIQRAYAAVETGFGVRDLRRRPAETPLRYLERIFGRRAAAAEPLGRLTALFQVARFSDEPVTGAMRGEAIEALRALRDEYRAVASAAVFGRPGR